MPQPHEGADRVRMPGDCMPAKYTLLDIEQSAAHIKQDYCL